MTISNDKIIDAYMRGLLDYIHTRYKDVIAELTLEKNDILINIKCGNEWINPFEVSKLDYIASKIIHD